MSAAPFTVGIIGLGRIACGLDTPDGPEIRTHLKACLADGRFRVAALSDIDVDRARRVAQDWAPEAEAIPPGDFVGRRFDAVCIATPDDTHAGLLEALTRAPPRAVLCEKPLAVSARDAEGAVASLEARDAAGPVHPPRRLE